MNFAHEYFLRVGKESGSRKKMRISNDSGAARQKCLSGGREPGPVGSNPVERVIGISLIGAIRDACSGRKPLGEWSGFRRCQGSLPRYGVGEASGWNSAWMVGCSSIIVFFVGVLGTRWITSAMPVLQALTSSGGTTTPSKAGFVLTFSDSSRPWLR
jgi:hypothetical protein